MRKEVLSVHKPVQITRNHINLWKRWKQ